ncbi:MAG TPA: cytochrome c peroxidase [Chitinophagaceae bacterium]|nr:cytochrome c peroxidase [Chitinophagaceae bacterium]
MLCRKQMLIITATVIFISTVSMSLKTKKQNLSEAVALVGQAYLSGVEDFESSLREYPKFFFDSSQAVRLQKYKDLVAQFKKIEWLFINLHPKQAYSTFLRPFQFQRRDSLRLLFPDNWLFNGPIGLQPDSTVQKIQAAQPQVITNQKRNINLFVAVFTKALEETNYKQDISSLSAENIFEALRLQIMKISTMDLANADLTIVEEPGMHSLRSVLSSWTSIVKIFLDQLPESRTVFKEKFGQLMNEGNQYLIDQENRFRKFDRMYFLTQYVLPLSNYLFELRNALEVKSINKFAAISPGARNLYEADVFNPDFFAPSEDAYLTKAKIELGKFLFFDPVLSDNNERACASCHKPELAFTDKLVKSVKFERKGGDLPRNAPTVINSGFQKLVFWDMRAASLEDQLDSVINNEHELHSSFDRVIDRINSSREYKKLFSQAFPETKKTGIQRKHVKIAIACYERALNGLNSRFDRYIRGDKTAMTSQEINGFNLFVGKARCATCHIPPLFNGTIPPYFEITDHKSIGVPLKDTMEVMQLDIDTGTAKTYQNPLFKFSFKTPTVRNAELTAPYMHNGVYKTLEQVVEFYNHAAGAKFIRDGSKEREKLPYPFFTILPDTLGLIENEKLELVAFMKTLTDTTSIKNIPKRLPELSGKYANLNRRKLGGVY